MAVFEIYAHPELRRYKTHICSKAVFVQLACLALMWIPPLLVVYRSEGFWQRVDSYIEHPDVKFKHELLMIVSTSTDGDYIAWSTYQNFNQLQMEHLRVPLVKATEEDLDKSGRNDELHLEIEVPLMDSENVYGVQLIIVFDYLIKKFSFFQMESLVYIDANSALPGGSLSVVGDLALLQSEPLSNKGIDTRYNESVIKRLSLQASDYDLINILTNYTARNVTTGLRGDHQVWRAGRGAGAPFLIDARIRYREEYDILFFPGFWQLIKWGWVQYVAVLVVFWFVFSRIQTFIFQNQLVTTIVERPLRGKSL